MQTVWEAEFPSADFILSVIISLAVMLLAVAVFFKKKKSHPVFVRCVCAAVFLAAASFLVFIIPYSHSEWRYAQEHLLTVEGEIEHFSAGPNGSEHFSVQNVYFSYPSEEGGLFGYNIPKRDRGSVIEGNGQYVRLTYYSLEGVNSILKIEIAERRDN